MNQRVLWQPVLSVCGGFGDVIQAIARTTFAPFKENCHCVFFFSCRPAVIWSDEQWNENFDLPFMVIMTLDGLLWCHAGVKAF